MADTPNTPETPDASDSRRHLDVLFPKPEIYHVGEKEVLAARLCWEDLLRIPRAFAGVLTRARVQGDGAATFAGIMEEGAKRMPELVVELAGASGTELTADEVRAWPAAAVLGYIQLQRQVNPELFPNLRRLVAIATGLFKSLGEGGLVLEKLSTSSAAKGDTASPPSGQ